MHEHVHEWRYHVGQGRWHRCVKDKCRALGDFFVPGRHREIVPVLCGVKDCTALAKHFGSVSSAGNDVWCDDHRLWDKVAHSLFRPLATGGIGCPNCYRATFQPGEILRVREVEPHPYRIRACVPCGALWGYFTGTEMQELIIDISKLPKDNKAYEERMAELLRKHEEANSPRDYSHYAI